MNKNSFYKKLEKFLTALIVVVVVCNFTAPSVLATEGYQEIKPNLLSNNVWDSTLEPILNSLGLDQGVMLGGMGVAAAVSIISLSPGGLAILPGIALVWVLLQAFVDLTLLLADTIMLLIGTFCGVIFDGGVVAEVTDWLTKLPDDNAKVLEAMRENWKGPHIRVGALFFLKAPSYIPPKLISPEDIFTGEIDLLSIDFISGKDASGNKIESTWSSIRVTISKWYKALRMFAIIALLSMLIYTGIKIILSSSARDKSKYKQWILNWFIGVGILFSMHYIMSFVISATSELVKVISTATNDVIITVESVSGTYADTVFNEVFGNVQDDVLKNVKTAINGLTKWYMVTNYMGAIRFFATCTFLPYQLMYMIMYIALCVYTIKFLFVYLKRMLSMAFLTLVAPIVALMYPLDKINDGQAQAFNMWLKEYIYNALLQPMHLILYYVLIGSSVSLAVENPIYAIVALAFMTEAERLLKKIFGFDKAGGGTVGGLSGAFAAGAIASNIGNIIGGAGKKIGQFGSDAADIALDMPKPIDNDYKDFQFPYNGAAASASSKALGEGNGDEVGNVSEGYSGKDTSNNAISSASENSLREEAQVDADGKALEDIKAQHAKEAKIIKEWEKEQKLKEAEIAPKSIEQIAQEKEAQRLNLSKGNAKTVLIANPNKGNGKKGSSPFQKGMTAVGKRMLKPIWDSDRSLEYNGKKWARRGAKFALGTGLGLTAAAVQAGISITDGKYSPWEGIATFTAGYMGAGKIIGGTESLVNTYTQGSLEGDKTGQMARYIENFKDRDDVIAFNKKNYPSDVAARIKREAEHYVPKGYTDLKQMKSCMKYADTLVAGGMNEEQADNQAAAIHFFIEEVKSQGQQKALYNQSAQEQYIEKVLEDVPEGSKSSARSNLEQKFKAAIAFNEANR